ncbi:MAG TPA: ABC transporter permease [Terriglobales bacterium]|jgi:predicted permease|nr:ABC transporter permease [Terriglobales bacterium]
MTGLLHDVRFAFRQLRRTPGFTVTAVLTLALGIGANTAIFTLVNAVLMKNLPVADPKSLLLFADRNFCCIGSGTPPDDDYGLFSTDAYEQMKKNAPEFEELAAMQAGFEYRPIVARRGGTPDTARSVMGEFISGNYFRTFGLRPAAGRLFSDPDDAQDAPMVAVMSYEKWKNDYANDPSIVGSTFFVNTKPVTIAGIAPEGFYGDRLSTAPPDFYLPIDSMPVIANVPYVHDADTNWLYIVGRVKTGYSIAQIQAKMTGLLQQALAPTRTYSTESGKAKLPKVHVVLSPGGAGIQHLQEGYASQLKLLMWTSALVLLIACANVANLLLVRGMARKAEMSVRTALGARRRRILLQLLTESVLLSGLGGIAGLFVAYAGTRMLLTLAFPGAATPILAGPSPVVLGFACGLMLLTGILFGIAPAWIATRIEPADALRSGSRTTVGGASLLQRGLVVAQAGVSLVLLVGAGLFSQSLTRLEHIDLKLDSRNRYIVHFNPQAPGYTQRQVGDLYQMLEQRFHAIPGVEKVGISTFTPMEDNNDGFSVRVQGEPDPHLSASFVKANSDYFDSVGTRVIAGRSIQEQDTPASTIIAVVNESFVKKLFKPGENPIGQHFGAPDRPGDYEIAGVVEDTAYTNATWTNHAMYFVPLLQRPTGIKKPIENDEMMYASALVLKTARPMNDMETLVRRTFSEINPNLAIMKFQSFDRQIADRFGDERMLAQLTALFGGLALLLTIVGLYGVTAYAVARRTPEIGIRVALGAERFGVTAMVLRGALIQVVVGLAFGIPAAFFCVRLVSSQLYQIKQVSLTAVVGAVLVLLASGVLAGLIPARRAAKVDPMVALRYE